MSNSLYVLKIGSSSIFSGEMIFDEIKEKIATHSKLLIVIGGNVGIEKHYQKISRKITYLTLKNGDEVRYASPEEMKHIISGYEDIMFPFIFDQFNKRNINAYLTCAFRNNLVIGRKIKPLLTVNAGKKIIIHDHLVGEITQIKNKEISALLETYDVVCIAAPIGNEDDCKKMFNIDADVLAAELACNLDADHVRFVTSTPGILKEMTTVSHIYNNDDLTYVTGKMKQKVKASRIVLKNSKADICITGPHSFSNSSAKTWFWDHEKSFCKNKERLTQAISIHSFSTDENDFAHYMHQQLKNAGIDSFIDCAGNLVATKGNGNKTLLLMGHMDTVPGSWKVKWSGNTLTGRGSVDAKSSLINFITLLDDFNVPQWGKLMVIGATEEEISSSKGAFYVRNNYPDIDAVIIGEPSGVDKLTLGYYGLFKVKITVKTEHGHSAGKEHVSSVDRLYEIVKILREDIYLHDRNTISTLIDIHSSSDKNYHVTTGILNFRLSPDSKIDYINQLINNNSSDKELIEIIILRATPGVAFKQTSSIAKAFQKSFLQNNIKPRYVIKKGTSDMNTLSTTWKNIPMVAYGPGDSALDHTEHEIIDLDEFMLSQKILHGAVRQWFESVK